MSQRPTYVIGITGGTGVGKSYFIDKLREKLSQHEVSVLSQDNYYKPRDQQLTDPLGQPNFDRPEAIDRQAFLDDIHLLLEGRTINRKEYTFNNPARTPKSVITKPAPILMVEGIFLFQTPGVEDLIDLKIFIDATEEIKIKRRIMRDFSERGYDMDDVLYKLEHHIAPAFRKYIAPYRDHADIIIPNNKGFDRALELLLTFIRTKIRQA